MTDAFSGSDVLQTVCKISVDGGTRVSIFHIRLYSKQRAYTNFLTDRIQQQDMSYEQLSIGEETHVINDQDGHIQ